MNTFRAYNGQCVKFDSHIATEVASITNSWGLISHIAKTGYVAYHLVSNNGGTLLYHGTVNRHTAKYEFGVREGYTEIF